MEKKRFESPEVVIIDINRDEIISTSGAGITKASNYTFGGGYNDEI